MPLKLDFYLILQIMLNILAFEIFFVFIKHYCIIHKLKKIDTGFKT